MDLGITTRQWWLGSWLGFCLEIRYPLQFLEPTLWSLQPYLPDIYKRIQTCPLSSVTVPSSHSLTIEEKDVRHFSEILLPFPTNIRPRILTKTALYQGGIIRVSRLKKINFFIFSRSTCFWKYLCKRIFLNL